MSLYARLESTTIRLIEKYGQSVTLSRKTPRIATSTSFQPTLIEMTGTAKAVETALNKNEVDGQNVLATDRILYVADFEADAAAWDWHQGDAFAVESWQCVAYGNGKWVKVSSEGTVAFSSNGTTWTESTVPAGRYYCVEYANSKWFIGGDDGAGTGVILTSSNGTTWSLVNTGAIPGLWRGISYAGSSGGLDYWLAVGDDGTNQILRSNDNGATWIPVAENGGFWQSVASDGEGNLVAVATFGAYRFASSNDYGGSWTLIAGPQASYWNDVTWTGTSFVAVSYDGAKQIATSPDGATWTLRDSPALSPASFSAVAYGDGFLLAVSDGSSDFIVSDDDGATWELYGDATPQSGWFGLGYGNGYFLAVALNGTNRVQTFQQANYSAPPQPGDGITVGGVELRIVAAEQVNPGGTNIMTICRARKS